MVEKFGEKTQLGGVFNPVNNVINYNRNTLPETNIAPEHRPFAPKGRDQSSNFHPFSGAFAISFGEGKCIQLQDFFQKAISNWFSSPRRIMIMLNHLTLGGIIKGVSDW